jgi:hypothetical protein
LPDLIRFSGLLIPAVNDGKSLPTASARIGGEEFILVLTHVEQIAAEIAGGIMSIQ